MKKTKIDKMVDRFLSWKLPDDFNPDGGILFTKDLERTTEDPHWPIGTNLFTAEQARGMIEYMLGENGHVLSRDCPCKPVVETYGNNDLVIHNQEHTA